MANNFATSVNILRDSGRSITYIPTPNAIQVVNQMVNDFKKGIRSFNIIGSYGTGKSSFLLALEQSVKGEKRFFNSNFIQDTTVDFLKIIGSYSSVIERFADILNVDTNEYLQENILSTLFNHYHSLGKNGILFIVLDEFGKFLEFASRNNPEKELYFIQQLAEFCNNPNHNIVLITTVHQSFESYSYTLSNSQKQEWTKVKGRFREITFNEPVEQLLYLASEHMNDNFSVQKPISSIEKVLDLSLKTKAFGFNHDFLTEIAQKIYPLDILSANIITLALQRYGQNERSLFTFLESTDHTGLSKFNNKENPFYNISCVYDYLHFNFYSLLTSRYNPDFAAWGSIRSSIEKVERTFDDSINEYVKIVKTVGLLNIFSASGAVLDNAFLMEYLTQSCGIENSEVLLHNLDLKQIIKYRNHSKRFVLFEGTDLDIEAAIVEAGNKISEVNDITSLLNKYFNFSPVFAKLYSYTNGTPRFFQFRISELPLKNDVPKGEIDGFINLVFNSNLNSDIIKEVSSEQEEAIVYCFFENSKDIKDLLFEIEKIKRVLDENEDDKVATKELENIKEAQIRLLNHYITDSIYSGSKSVKWFFRGREQKITSKKDFIKLLSQVCVQVYDATPTFINELVNRHKISSSIHTAKKNYFRALTNEWNLEDLGFDKEKFPPEKTIYLSLIKENNVSTKGESTINETSTFYKLWKESERFIESAKSEPKKIIDFVEILGKKPFKLKQGLIDFWVPTFLFIKRDDFAIFNENGFVPYLSEENIELIAKEPQRFTIKSFDIEGIKLDVFNSYRTLLNQSVEDKFDNNSFIETIKPFLVFYKGLPEYSKNTKRLSPVARKIRQAIAKSKNPEETFFEDFPNALGLSLNVLQNDQSKLQNYSSILQGAIKEIRTSFDELVQRFETFICSEIVGEEADFETYKLHLQKRFKKLKKHLLLNSQKTFIQRIDSALDDKKAWLNSLAQALMGKTLEVFADEDELLLYEKFKATILELDSLTKISKTDIDDKKEEVISVKIDSFFTKIDPKIVRIPKNKSKEIEHIQEALKTKLGEDKTTNIAALLNLLKELM